MVVGCILKSLFAESKLEYGKEVKTLNHNQSSDVSSDELVSEQKKMYN